MFNKYYQQELQNLRDLGQEFSKVHPAIAPMLSGPTSDPDVERLLEGVAFLTGLLHRKLDDDYPEIIHGLMDITFPHYLRPIPSTSIVAFKPKQSLLETITVPAGVSLASIPVEGTRCIFRTCFDTDVHPLRLISAESSEKPDNNGQIKLDLELSGLNLSQWNPKTLGFCLGGSYSQATNNFMLLTGYVRRIILKPAQGEEGKQCVLPPDALVLTGFERKNSVLSYPAHAFSGYRLLQEYFVLPQKFLFLELRGWEKWLNRGTGSRFEIIFDVKPSPLPFPRINREHFILFATPVINLFRDTTDQFLIDHRLEKTRVRPASKMKGHYQIYSVDRVVGYKQGSVTKKEYTPLELFSKNDENKSTYQVVRSKSPIDDSMEYYLAFTYPPGGPEPEPETLSLTMTFTNGPLPERLQAGDISEQTSDSPGLVDFYNLIPPTLPLEPEIGKNMLWKLLSHLSLNFLSLASTENMKNLLKLYIFPDARNRAQTAANLKRIEGILDVSAEPIDRIVNGVPMRGQKINMTMRQDNFASFGDLYLFASMLDLFMGVYSSMNTFIQFELKDSISGETFQWPARLGDRHLI